MWILFQIYQTVTRYKPQILSIFPCAQNKNVTINSMTGMPWQPVMADFEFCCVWLRRASRVCVCMCGQRRGWETRRKRTWAKPCRAAWESCGFGAWMSFLSNLFPPHISFPLLPEQITTNLRLKEHLSSTGVQFHRSEVSTVWGLTGEALTRLKSRCGQGRTPFWELCGKLCFQEHSHHWQNSLPSRASPRLPPFSS